MTYKMKIKSSMLSLLLLATVSGSSVLAQEAMPGKGETVQLAQTNDDSGKILTYIYGQLLEELGFKMLPPLTLDIPVAFQATAQGNVDVYPNGWFPLHNTYLENVGDGAEVVGYGVAQGAIQGYLVDKASAEKFDIKTLDDFKRPEVQDAFDRNGDGKADLVACPPGWGCELTINYQMDAFGLEDHVNQIKAGYAASIADAIAAYGAGEPIFFYTWTPNWIVDELKLGEDIVWIETPSIMLPEDQREFADVAVIDNVEGCVADPCQLGWPVNDIRPLASTQFLEDHPSVRVLLEEASVSLPFLFKQNAIMRNGEDSIDDLKRHAAEYLDGRREEVDKWLDKARAAEK